MKKLGRVLSFSIGLGAAVALVGHISSGTTRAVDIDHVNVVNSASDPVPAPGGGAASVLPDAGALVHGVNFMLKSFIDVTFCVETDVAVNTTPRVYLAPCTGRANQRWTFTDGEDGSSVVVGDRGFCLKAERGSKPEMLGIATCDYRADQRFEVTPAGLIIERHSDNCLTVGSPILSGAAIFVEECQDPMVAEQAWRLAM